jgi:2,4-dienoyl-CoA reductase-like NADH-dependent reductase (Old Yellow Enzyme family)
MDTLFTPLTLASGSTLANRIAKAAMEENLAVAGQLPGAEILGLYRQWAAGGAGLILTGNVMIDGRAMTGPGGVVLQADTPLEPFREWASVAKAGGAQVWMQINHPGRQVYSDLPGVAWSPSDVAVNVGKQSHRFARPTPMTEADIAEVITRFADTARQAEAAGFDGVEIHAAHGYLISQFLSPLANRRTDRWGGTLENRARLLIEAVKAVRATVPPGFAVAVKLNSADFQRGGFDAADAEQVIRMLGGLHVDLVELSGGTVESPAMQGQSADERTLAREAYFLALARELLATAPMPIMITGGVTRRPVAQQVIASGVAVVGMANALAMVPDLPRQWQAGQDTAVSRKPIQWKDKTLAAAAGMAFARHQLKRLAAGKRANPDTKPVVAFVLDRVRRRTALRRYRRWLPAQAVGHRADESGHAEAVAGREL